MLQELEQPYGYDVTVNDAFRPLSKFFDRVWRPEQLPAALLGAMRVLTDPAETGAVTIALPQDVQAEAYDWPEELFAKRVWHIARPVPEPAALERAAAIIRGAQRPLVVAGGGVHYSEATEALRAFAEATGIPVGDTQAGKGALLWDHPQAVGGVGSTGSPVANALAREADVVIGVGTRYSDFTTASRTAFQHPGVRFVNLNVAAFDAAKHAGAMLVADAREGLDALRAALDGYRASVTWDATDWNRVVDEAFHLGHQPLPAQTEVLGALNEEMDARDVVVQAAGSMPGDLQMLWRARDAKQYHVEYAYSCMGYEIAGALGIKMAAPDREVFALVGDGSYLMMASEIVTAVSEGIKLNLVIVQNHGFASIGALSESLGSQRFGTNYRYRDPATGMLTGDKLPVDLAANAESLGAKVIRVKTIEEFRAAIATARARRRHHRHPHRDRPARPRPQLRELVGRAGERGRRTRLHPTGAQGLRGPQARPEAPDRRHTAVRTVSHWIGGKPATGTSTPDEPGLEPGHRRAAGRGAAGLHRGRRRPPCSRRGRVRVVVAVVAVAAHQGAVRVPRAGQRAHQASSPRSSPTSTARCSPTPRARCSAAWRSIEFACGIPTLLKGEFSDQVSTGVDLFSFRQPLGVCAGITPFNFPAMVPMWMYPVAIADRQHVRAQAERARPVGLAVRRRAVGRGRPARRRVQRGARRQGGRRRAARPPGRRRGLVRRLHPDRQVHPRDGPRARQARAGARRGEEPRHRAARRGHRLRLRPPRRRRVRLGGRALHGHLRRRRRRAARPTSSSPPCREKARAIKVGPGRDAESEMGPVITAAARDRIVGLIGTGAEQGADLAVDGRGLTVAGHENGFFVGPTVIDQVTHRRWTSTARRSSARCCRWCAWTPSTTPSS